MKKSPDTFASIDVKRLIAPLVCTAGLFVLNDAQAASLGKMKVLSALGAAFNAEIELANVAPEEEANLTAKIAPPDLFRRAGLEYNPSLSNFKATINKDVRPFKIMLHSSSVVSEPLLEMLMDLNWQSGRLVRQYTVLLDPITSADEVPVAAIVTPPAPQVTVQTPAATQPAPAAVSNIVKNNAPAEAIEPKAAKVAKAGGASALEYSVKKGDTLYSITKALVAGNPTHINQLMNLLVKNNPNSFTNQDKNRLKSGVVLNTSAAKPFADGTVDETKKIAAANKPISDAATSKAFSKYKQAAAAQPKVIKAANTSKLVRSAIKNEESKPLAATQDQLKVTGKAAVASKGTPASAKTEEAKIAETRAIAEAKTLRDHAMNNIKGLVTVSATPLANATTVSTPLPAPTTIKPAAVATGIAATVAATALTATAVTAPVATTSAPIAATNTNAAVTAVTPAVNTVEKPAVAITPLPPATTDATVAV